MGAKVTIKHVILYYFSFLDKKFETKYNDSLKRAYELCQKDPFVSYEYGMSLMHESTFDRAEKIFLEIVKNEKYYPIYVDLSLAEIYTHGKKKDQAEKYLIKVKSAESYLDQTGKDKLKKLSEKL